MKTGLITTDTYQNHNTGDGHPEKIDRVTSIINNFKKLNNKNLVWKKPVKFDSSYLINTHSFKYINRVDQLFPKKDLTFLDGDTVILIKDLKVKGTSVTIKRGTSIKNIRLTNNPKEIDCKFKKVKCLVLKTEFVKKN